jgi:ABC-type spermidine/putrescine transport system permease subunit II
MHEIKSFDILQTSKVIAVMYAIMAAIISVFVAIGALLHGHPGRAILALIFMPILYGIGTFIFAAFFCWIYNQVASRLGGVAFELSPSADSSRP